MKNCDFFLTVIDLVLLTIRWHIMGTIPNKVTLIEYWKIASNSIDLFEREGIYLYGISIYRTHATGRSMKAILLRVRTLTLIIFEWHLISVIAFLSNFEIWLFWQPSIISATALQMLSTQCNEILFEELFLFVT